MEGGVGLATRDLEHTNPLVAELVDPSKCLNGTGSISLLSSCRGRLGIFVSMPNARDRELADVQIDGGQDFSIGRLLLLR